MELRTALIDTVYGTVLRILMVLERDKSSELTNCSCDWSAQRTLAVDAHEGDSVFFGNELSCRNIFVGVYTSPIFGSLGL